MKMTNALAYYGIKLIATIKSVMALASGLPTYRIAGATTLRITTISITALSIMTLSVTTLCITTHSITIK
jgi:hypothetical protein